jgi:outer membrane protein OmpA-like peptidoglycan-associated protein
MRNILVFLLTYNLIYPCIAQNLVVNGGFEDKQYCPSTYNQQSLRVIKGWSQLGEGTPDYFNVCSTTVGIPENMFGHQPSHAGEGYAGMALYSPGKRNYREYLNTKLERPLSAGEMVCIELFVSPADYCMYVVDHIGIVLSDKPLVQDRSNAIITKSAMENPRLNMLDEGEIWLRLSDVYTAKGGEQYLAIGNFHLDKETEILHRTREMGAKDNNTWAYAYVDDVSVTSIKKKEECSCENEIIAEMVNDPPLELSEFDKIRLDAVLFDFDKDQLTQDAIAQLNEIYVLLRKNKHMYMEITGHTDIIGNDGYNDDLSRRRAETVIAYLEKKGIARERLIVLFKGSHEPTADNHSAEGRAKNRRVEFQVLRKRYELIK